VDDLRMPFPNPRVLEIGFVRREPPNPRWQISGTLGPDWHVLAVSHGGLASYQVDGNHLVFRRGDVLCLQPGMQRTAASNPRDPWDFTVCGFRLSSALQAPVQLTGGPRSPALRLAEELLAAWTATTREGGYRAFARLHDLLALLAAGGAAGADPRIEAALARLATLPPAGIPSAATVARTCGLSPSHFRDLFRAATGQPFHHWQLVRRLECARGLLLGGATDLAAVAMQAGFSDTRYLSRMFRKHLGTTPSACRLHR
jgi:AraC-like DNA-binding protein